MIHLFKSFPGGPWEIMVAGVEGHTIRRSGNLPDALRISAWEAREHTTAVQFGLDVELMTRWAIEGLTADAEQLFIDRQLSLMEPTPVTACGDDAHEPCPTDGNCRSCGCGSLCRNDPLVCGMEAVCGE